MADRSDVDICNLALIAIGHTDVIASLTEDSTEAAVCRAEYSTCLDEVLEAFAWPFATRRAAPAQIGATTLDLGAVPSGWAYAYALPADCVPNGLRRVYSGTRNPTDGQETPHAVEYDGKTDQVIVLTDDDSPEFIYTARVSKVPLYSASFVRALAERLAIELARGLKKDPRVLAQHQQAYDAALAKAASSAKRAVKPDETPAPSWIANR